MAGQRGRDLWETCDLQPRVLPKELLLAGDSQLSVKLPEDCPLADWPRAQGLWI